MRMLPRTVVSPIGLDLGTHAFKAVQVTRAARGRVSVATLSLPRVTPGVDLTTAEIDRLHAVLDRRGFAGQDVVLAVPAAGLLSSMLELPARGPGVPLEQIAAAEFARVHKLEPAAVSMSTWELPAPARASRATYMLAVGAKTATLDAHADVVEAGGLNVAAVDDPCSAVARAGVYVAPAAEGLTAVVDLGWSAATLVILNGDRVIYTRKLADGGLAAVYEEATANAACEAADVEHEIWQYGLTGAAAEQAGASAVLDTLAAHVSAALREVGQAFGYATHQYPDAAMGGVLLTGGGASIPGLDARFADALGVPARPAAGHGVVPVMMQALGLALFTEATR